MRSTSFISEHSAEYILIPQLIASLTRVFPRVVPIYFWLSREGSLIAQDCSPSQVVSVVNVFARRPKLISVGQEFIEVTFNDSLFESAVFASSLGIPTFAGVPVASSIMDLGLHTVCAWFQLKELSAYATVRLLLDGTVVDRFASEDSLLGPLTEFDLVSKIRNETKSMPWKEAVEHLKAIRRASRKYRFHPFAGGYHPFHLLLIR